MYLFFMKIFGFYRKEYLYIHIRSKYSLINEGLAQFIKPFLSNLLLAEEIEILLI